MREESPKQSSNKTEREMKVVQTIVLFAALTGAATCLFTKWYFMMMQNMTWTDAQRFCRNKFTDLWSINIQQEDKSLKSDFYPTFTYWIGLSKGTEESNYTRWSDESTLGYTNWAPGQPDGKDTEHCVVIENAAWHDRLCENTYYVLCYTWDPRLIVVQEMKTWEEALKHCRTFYTDLISLTTSTDLLAINMNAKNVQTPSFWTGLRFLDGEWFWVNKEILGNLVYLPSCPAPDLRCGARRTGVNVFENRDCEEKMNFICYKSE